MIPSYAAEPHEEPTYRTASGLLIAVGSTWAENGKWERDHGWSQRCVLLQFGSHADGRPAARLKTSGGRIWRLLDATGPARMRPVSNPSIPNLPRALEAAQRRR